MSLFGGGKSGMWTRTPVIKSAIDTQMNRLGRARPRPFPMTVGGDWDAQLRAERLKVWIDGWFEKLNVDHLARLCLLDGLILGTGALKGHLHDGIPTLEHIWPGDLHVSVSEERHSAVRTLYQSSAVDRGALIDRFPDFEEQIDLEDPFEDVELTEDEEISDLVLVIEAWRLPTTRDENGEWKGGRHYVCIKNQILNRDESDWHSDGFPFAFYRYRERPRSFWGQGIVESSGPMQADLNELDSVLNEAYATMTPGMLVQAGSIPTRAQTNAVGRIIEYTGARPESWSPAAVSPDFLARGETLEQKIFRSEGISLMSSQSLKPAGLDSGLALTTHEDIESERHAIPSQNFETLHMDAGKLLVELTEQVRRSIEGMDEEDGEARERAARKLSVLGGKDALELIDYEDSRLEPGCYVFRMWPVSRFSRSVTGQLAQTEKLTQMGLFQDPDELYEVLDFPDLQGHANTRLAGRKLVRQMVQNALHLKPAFVHPYMPLDYLVEHATLRRCQAELDGAPDEALERVDELLGAAIAEMEKKAAALAPPPVPPMPGMPGMDPSMMGGMGGMDPSMMPPPPPQGPGMMPGPPMPPGMPGLPPPTPPGMPPGP
jgi:hypothetical protein